MIWLGAHFALVATAVIFTLTWSLVMQERRTPQSTLAWMGFIILLPYAAIPAFLIFGYRKRRNLPSAALPPPGRETGADDLDRLLTGYGVAPAGSGNTFRLLFEGAPAYEAMMELVRGAQESLSVTLYVLGDDEVGRAFCAALAMPFDRIGTIIKETCGTEACPLWKDKLARPAFPPEFPVP